MSRTVIDLFCGAGGFSLGFILENYELLLGLDIDEFCIETYKYNFPSALAIKADIRDIHSKDILRYVDRPDVIIASPPCEAFTRASRNIMKEPIDRLYTDPRGRLMLDAIRIIGDLKPDVFIIENVPGINEPAIRDSIRYELSRYGYEKIYFNVIDAEKLGCPSMRRRIFISNIPIKIKRRARVNVWDAIKDLPDPRFPSNIPNHEYVHLPLRFEERVRRLKWGEGLEYFMGSEQKVYLEYIRVHPNKPSPTVMGRSRFIHPYENRLLTVREQARLMTYPDTHVFFGPINSQYNQVGESVPPLVSKLIAEYLKRFI